MEVETLDVMFQCMQPNCKQEPRAYRDKACPTYRIALLAIWFHGYHEGHLFDYWENSVKILSPDKGSDQVAS